MCRENGTRTEMRDSQYLGVEQRSATIDARIVEASGGLCEYRHIP